ncbi:MAG: hypothetical protein GX455_05415 [Phycisphaerae bacterium]|nr:hypothetical protein [Phycisphaerae bacterium]
MNDKQTRLGDLLASQESANPNTLTSYRQIVRSLVDRKPHWLTRGVCGLLALTGVVFCVSLLVELFERTRGNYDAIFIIKFSLVLLLICVLFYTLLAAGVAILGKVPLGGTPATIFGAVLMAGFFVCLWSFLTFPLPRLVQLAADEASDPFTGNLWIISLVCMLILIALFGILTAGITFLIHLMYSQYGRTREKLLEIELALAELSERTGEERSKPGI